MAVTEIKKVAVDLLTRRRDSDAREWIDIEASTAIITFIKYGLVVITDSNHALPVAFQPLSLGEGTQFG